MTASLFLRAARARRGWSQRELASRCGVAQPSLSDIESGARDTTVDKLEQILHATAHRLVVIPTTRPTVAEWSLVLRDVVAHDPGALEKCLVQISDDLWAADGATCVAATVTPPPPTGARSADAAVAALVEHHLAQRNLPVPAWVHDRERISDEPWDLIAVKSLQALARDATPEPFRRRNVYLPADLFESV